MRGFRAACLGLILAVGLAGYAVTTHASGAIPAAQTILKARDQAAKRLNRRPRDRAALAKLGWGEYTLGRYTQAVAAFQRLLRLEADNVSAWLGLGWSQYRLGDLNKAEASFLAAKKAFEDRPGSALEPDVDLADAAEWTQEYQSFAVADGLAWVAFARGDLARAESFFRAESERRSTSDVIGDGQLGLGWIAAIRGDLSGARRRFEQGLRHYPQYFRLHDGLARVALAEGNAKIALAHALDGYRHVWFDFGLTQVVYAALDRIGDPRLAAKVFGDIARDHPGIAANYNSFGWWHLKHGRARAAEASFQAALKISPKYKAARLGLKQSVDRMNAVVDEAWQLYEKGAYRAALSAFEKRRAEAERAGSPAALTGAGWSRLALGDVSGGKSAFRAALRIDPNFASAKEGMEACAVPHRALYLQAWRLAEANHLDEADAHFRRAAERAPANFRWRVDEALAWVALYRKQLAAAERGFLAVLARHPKAHLSRKGLGYVAIARGEYDTGWRHLKQSFSAVPNQVLASYTVPADRLIEAGRQDIALKVLHAGLRVYPNSADIFFLFAKTQSRSGQHRYAMINAAVAARLAPKYIDRAFDDLKMDIRDGRSAYHALAWGLYWAGDNEGALRRFKQILAVAGDDEVARRGLGYSLYRLGRRDEAVRELTIVARHKNPGLLPMTEFVPIAGTRERWSITYNANSIIAWAHLREGRARKAAAVFREVLRTHPNWFHVHAGLGFSLLRLGDRKGAVRRFRLALLLSPGYPEALRGLRLSGEHR